MNAKASGQTRRAWLALKGRDWLSFNRADYLATKILLGAAVIGSAMFGLGAPIQDAVNSVPLVVSYTTKVTSGIELPRGATLDGAAAVELQLTDATIGERMVQALPGLLLSGLIIAVAWLLFQLLRDIQANEPFTRRNVRRIYAIGSIVGIGGMLVQYAQGFADNAIQLSGRLPEASSFTLAFSLNPLPLVVTAVILLVGEAFRRGVTLRHDVEGLV